MKKNIKDFSREELKGLMKELGEKSFRAEQLWQNIYRHRMMEFSEMGQLSKKLRERLAEDYYIGSIADSKMRESSDGTVKFLYRLHDGKSIESVLIIDRDDDDKEKRLTLCISSQVGCGLGCKFCATGSMGFSRNLSVGEIVDQYIMAEKLVGKRINNIVYMGMGEPLQNYQNMLKSWDIFSDKDNEMSKSTGITISTVGLVDKIRGLADSGRKIKLALSLHASSQGQREKILPAAKKNSLGDLRKALEYYYQRVRIAVTFEYIVFAGYNNNDDDVKRLRKITSSFPSKINLIPYHDIEFTGKECMEELKEVSPEGMEAFAENLRRAGVNVFVRSSSGLDIEAACGQLALSENKTENKED